MAVLRVQVWQLAPAIPQLPKPDSSQVLPEQQPFAHEVVVHWQLPFMQTWPAAHFVLPPQVQAPFVHPSAFVALHVPQPAPFVPQAKAVGMTQVLPEQQPFGQLAGVQPLQTPPAEQVPPRHTWQAEPPMPHAVAVGVVHVFPAQQPVGQDVPSHTQLNTPALETHSWPTPQAAPLPHVHTPVVPQALPVCPQAAHELPRVPQAAAVGASHTLPLQQPLGHEAASQTHLPPEQA